MRTTALVLAAAVAASCASAPKRLQYSYAPPYGVASDQFLRSLEGMRYGMVAGNRLELLENGDGLFPPMLEALRVARRSINVETYLFVEGAIAHDLADVLIDRARAGVEVRVLVDGVGARMGALSEEMRKSGVQVRTYKPIKLYTVHRIQDRTHRRLVVIDGRVGFTGGFGIDDRWRGDARSPDEWRDLAVRVEGPAVRILQRTFIEDWLHTTGEVLHDYRQFPPVENAGTALAQVVASSRGEHVSTAKLMFYMAIQAARERVWLENAYFAPDRQILEALVAAAGRGVDVRVVVPGPNIDIPQIRRAARTNYGELLEAGVKIYEYLPSMLHTKAMVADGVWATVGTINLVTRSMKKNAEVNLVAYDREFAATVERAIEADLRRSQPISLQAWRQRGLWERFRDQLSDLFHEAY